MHIDAVVVGEATEPAVMGAARRAGIALLHLRVAPGGEAGTFDLVAERTRPPVAATAVAPDDVALVTQTSGTTSAPKIVPLEHWRLVGSARDRAYPELPTAVEQGVPDFVWETWQGIVAPAGIAGEILEAPRSALRQACTSAEFRAGPEQLGFEPIDEDPQAFPALLRDETAMYRRLIDRAGLRGGR